jgi:hypothetical protein
MRKISLFLLVSLLLLPSWGRGEEVKLRVKVILASTQGSQVDPQITKGLKKYLERSFGARYTSFRQLDNRVLKVKAGGTGQMTLPDQSVLKLTFREVVEQFIRITMELKDLKTTVKIKSKGMFFQAGHRYQTGVLILAISASLEEPKPKPREPKVEPTPVETKADPPEPEPEPEPEPVPVPDSQPQL